MVDQPNRNMNQSSMKALEELAQLFRAPLVLKARRTDQSRIPAWRMDKRTESLCPGSELRYDDSSDKESLYVSFGLIYLFNSKGHPYPSDLLIAADFQSRPAQDIMAKPESFVYHAHTDDYQKRLKYDLVCDLNLGTTLQDLITALPLARIGE